MDPSENQAQIFKVLSADTRVRMIELLKSRPYCVSALAHTLDISPAAVSQHLRVLRDSGLVEADRQGYFVHYRLNRETLAEWNRAARSLLEVPAENGSAGQAGQSRACPRERDKGHRPRGEDTP